VFGYLLAALVIVLSGGQSVDQRSNFSGRWSIVPDRSILAGPEGPIQVTVFGEEFEIRETGGGIAIAVAEERPFVWQHNLDGTEVRQHYHGTAVISRVHWRGDTLVIGLRADGMAAPKAGPVESTRELRLRADGTLAVAAPWGPDRSMVTSVYSRTASTSP